MFNSGNCGVPLMMNVEPANSGNNGSMNGWGGDWIWILVVFALLFGWGNNGWGGNGGNGGGNAQFIPYQVGSTYTDAAIQRGFDNQAVISKLDGINSGLCDGFYAQNTNMLTGFGNLQNAVQSGFAGVDNAICNLGYNMQQGFNTTQVANMQGNFALQQAINADTVANMQNTNAISTQLANCCCAAP